jgi:hypothetical protein
MLSSILTTITFWGCSEQKAGMAAPTASRIGNSPLETSVVGAVSLCRLGSRSPIEQQVYRFEAEGERLLLIFHVGGVSHRRF